MTKPLTRHCGCCCRCLCRGVAAVERKLAAHHDSARPAVGEGRLPPTPPTFGTRVWPLKAATCRHVAWPRRLEEGTLGQGYPQNVESRVSGPNVEPVPTSDPPSLQPESWVEPFGPRRRPAVAGRCAHPSPAEAARRTLIARTLATGLLVPVERRNSRLIPLGTACSLYRSASMASTNLRG